MATRKKRITKKVLFAKTIEILKPKLHLDNWCFTVKYSRTMRSAIATCTAEPEYRQATIRFSLSQCVHYSHYEIISTAIHEMLHCAAWPLAQLTQDFSRKDPHKIELTRRAEETVITHLEHAFTEMAFTYLQSELRKQGYADIDDTVEKMILSHEPVTVQKKARKKKRK